MFTETAILDNRLLFVDQRRQMSVFRFQQTKRKFAVPIFRLKKQTKVAVFG
jgi:hypothetical protein